MAKDMKGNFHISGAKARQADRSGISPEEKVPGDHLDDEDEGEKGDINMTPHGDGTYHTEADGERTEHPDLGHALMHIAVKVEPGAKHMHVSDDGYGPKTHGVSEGGEHTPTEEHSDGDEAGEAVKAHFGSGMQEEKKPTTASGMEHEEASLY